MSGNSQGATWCSEGVAGFDLWRCNIVFKGDGGADVSRCNVLFTGGGGDDVLSCWRCNIVFRGGARANVLWPRRCNIVFRWGGGDDVLQCPRCNVLFRGKADLVSCAAPNAIRCSDEGCDWCLTMLKVQGIVQREWRNCYLVMLRILFRRGGRVNVLWL